MKCCLSIDFEDFSYDLAREMGVKRPRTCASGLVKSYERFRSILAELPGSRQVTFFCTGQVAKEHSEIVGRIAADGHEVACHSMYHDPISEMDRAEFADSLDMAIEALSSASGQPVRGFRAPSFTIPNREHWAYEELAKRFVYDSSFVTGRRQNTAQPYDIFPYGKYQLAEFPLYGRRLGPFSHFKVIGGTYLKLLPAGMILETMREAAAMGFLPLVYLHPYEFLYSGEFWLGPKDLPGVSVVDRAYYQLRQHQWLSVRNRGVARKLGIILREFEHAGTMYDQVLAGQKKSGSSNGREASAE